MAMTRAEFVKWRDETADCSYVRRLDTWEAFTYGCNMTWDRIILYQRAEVDMRNALLDEVTESLQLIYDADYCRAVNDISREALEKLRDAKNKIHGIPPEAANSMRERVKQLDEHLSMPSGEVARQLEEFMGVCDGYGIEIGTKSLGQLKRELAAAKRAEEGR